MSDSTLDRIAEPLALGLLQLREDPQYVRIPARRRVALVEAALEDGRVLAERTGTLYGTDPAVMAWRCGVPVVLSDDDAGFGSVIVYAAYAMRPPCITLYRPAIRHLDRLIAARGARPNLGIDRTQPVFLAHELYHHFDCARGGGTLSRRHRVRIFGVGRWNWTSGLSSLCEIAAGAFAQRLLGLSFHPRRLDLLVMQKSRGTATLNRQAQ